MMNDIKESPTKPRFPLLLQTTKMSTVWRPNDPSLPISTTERWRHWAGDDDSPCWHGGSGWRRPQEDAALALVSSYQPGQQHFNTFKSHICSFFQPRPQAGLSATAASDV